MVLFNYSTKEITAKIVYYGPGLCGKTSNLQFIYDNLPATINKGRMLSLATKTDRTLFFDFLPIDLGTIRGLRTRLQLYTVPGQVFYNTTRKLVLKGADGVVFVADSQKRMIDANLESFRNLADNLAEHDMKLAEMPLIIQFNKRDLPDVATLDELNAALNKYNAPIYEAVATTGIGVHETLRAATRLVLNSLKERYAERRDERVDPGVQAAALAAAQQKSARRPALAEATAPAIPPVPAIAPGPATISMRRPIEPTADTPPAGIDFMDLQDSGGALAIESTPDETHEPVLELALDDDIPLELTDEPIELEIEEPAPFSPDVPSLSGLLDELDEPAEEPQVHQAEPVAASFSGLEETLEQEPWSIPLDDEPLAAGPAPTEPQPDDEPFSLVFDDDEADQAFTSPGVTSVLEDTGGAPIPLAPREQEHEQEVDELEDEPHVIVIEDSHDDLLSVGLQGGPSDEPVPVRADDTPVSQPLVSSRVVAVDAATAGQQEIHVPIELAIGGKSIRFDLRISLDLSHAVPRESMAGMEDRRR